MKFAIIAAGNGSRLAAEGVTTPKPLVAVGNELLIDRLIRIFMKNGADEIVVICNDKMTEVSEHLITLQNDGLLGHNLPLRFIIKSTPSSMHSFYELSQYLEDDAFVLTTVDTIFKEDDFATYVQSFRQQVSEGTDAYMGVTDYIDDEKPLYVDVDESMAINGFYDTAEHGCKYISGGIYGLTPKTIHVLKNCIEHGEQRMRNYQRGLIKAGLKVKAYPFSTVFDIDHAEDIRKADDFLA